MHCHPQIGLMMLYTIYTYLENRNFERLYFTSCTYLEYLRIITRNNYKQVIISGYEDQLSLLAVNGNIDLKSNHQQ